MTKTVKSEEAPPSAQLREQKRSKSGVWGVKRRFTKQLRRVALASVEMSLGRGCWVGNKSHVPRSSKQVVLHGTQELVGANQPAEAERRRHGRV